MLKLITASFAALVCILAACGKSELAYRGPDSTAAVPPAPAAPTNLIKVRYGTLVLEKSPLVKSAFVDYSIYEDGTVTYEGAVSFFGHLGHSTTWRQDYLYLLLPQGMLFTTSFRGIVKARATSILSKSYKTKGAILLDKELQLKVGTNINNRCSVAMSFIEEAKTRYATSGSPTDKDSTGSIEIDTSEDIIDIVGANLYGKVFGTQVNLVVRKKTTDDVL